MLRSRIALLSVADKTGIDEFARRLIDLGWSIVASPGTARFLHGKEIPAVSLEDYTGISPILGHRVFSEHFKIAGALVAESTPEHDQDRETHDIPWFDLICVDLYPLSKAIAEASSEAQVIESTDIGGVTLIRNAVKGRRIVLTDISDRQEVLELLEKEDDIPEAFRRRLWYQAEALCADYCLQSAQYLGGNAIDGFVARRGQELRYGENPYQSDATYYRVSDEALALHNFPRLSGTQPSFVNMTSLSNLVDSLARLCRVFSRNYGGRVPNIAIGAKHGIAVGAAVDWESTEKALKKMLWSSPVTIWGGEVITNFKISGVGAGILQADTERKSKLGSANWMLDIIAAPEFEESAIELLGKKEKRRILQNPALENPDFTSGYVYRYVRGGFLRQPVPDYIPDIQELEWIGKPLFGSDLDTLLLAWAIAWSMPMNGIAVAGNGQLLAADGQPSSVGAVQSCVVKMADTGHDTIKNVFAANAFLPFIDSAELFTNNRAYAGILPGGGVREQEIRQYFSAKGVTLAFVPEKYRGFAHH